ncbi:hypothetical protein ACP70R_018050 [Stipagrostis hirtigluma subsp. patula]
MLKQILDKLTQLEKNQAKTVVALEQIHTRIEAVDTRASTAATATAASMSASKAAASALTASLLTNINSPSSSEPPGRQFGHRYDNIYREPLMESFNSVPRLRGEEFEPSKRRTVGCSEGRDGSKSLVKYGHSADKFKATHKLEDQKKGVMNPRGPKCQGWKRNLMLSEPSESPRGCASGVATNGVGTTIVRLMEILILVDSGSVSSFINAELAQEVPVTAFVVADGGTVQCTQMVQDLSWWVQGHRQYMHFLFF